jgi:hypothetical protein
MKICKSSRIYIIQYRRVHGKVPKPFQRKVWIGTQKFQIPKKNFQAGSGSATLP